MLNEFFSSDKFFLIRDIIFIVLFFISSTFFLRTAILMNRINESIGNRIAFVVMVASMMWSFFAAFFMVHAFARIFDGVFVYLVNSFGGSIVGVLMVLTSIYFFYSFNKMLKEVHKNGSER